MTIRDTARLPFLATLLALSGVSALIYQIAWLREFRLVFGGATPATAAVLAIFMGGLGAGSAWFGRQVERSQKPLRLYALIEIGVGASALLTPVLLTATRAMYVKTGGVVALGLVPATLLQLLLATVVLAVPCLLMGGSLPAAFKWGETDSDQRRGTLGILYGVNALGAVAGVLLATFWLLEHWGIRLTVTAAAVINILIGVAAWAVARDSGQVAPNPGTTKAHEGTALVVGAKAPMAFVYAAAAVTGFTFFLSELVWFRMLAPLVGSSVYGFGLILALALAGIGLGGLVYRVLLAPRTRAISLGGLAIVAAMQALLFAVPWALGDRIAVLAIDLSHSGAESLGGRVLDWTTITSLLVVGPSLMAGIQFPLLVGLLGEGTRDAGRHVGFAYAANTLGAIAGSLSGGFVLLPALTAPGCWRLVALLTLGLSIWALLLAAGSVTRLVRFSVTTLLLGALSLIVLPTGPTAVWRHQPIGYGDRIETLPSSINERRYVSNNVRQTVPYEFEGREASVAILASDTGWSLNVNGKSDGSAFGDAFTQVMLGLLPAMLHPAPKNAFVVGLGTGSTAGWLADVPGMARVDVVELEPGMSQLARTYFTPVNRDVMSKANVNLIVGDAREALLVAGPRYDLIVSEPSNPYRAGIATLFTREYYQAVKSRLAEGGVFAQWLQGYEVDTRSVQLVYATLASVFPNVETWSTGPGDLVFIAHPASPSYSMDQLRSKMAQPLFAEALLRVWFTRTVEGVLAHHFASPHIARQITQKDPTPNTDDKNQLEYGFARGLAQRGTFNPGQLLADAMEHNADVPTHLVNQVNRSRLQLERLLMWAGERTAADPLPGLLGDDLRRAVAVRAYVEERFTDVLSSWVGKPGSPMEQLLLLESAAASGTPGQVLPLVELVARDWPADALVAAALSAWRQNQPAQATAHLQQAFSALRTQVWSRPRAVESGLALAARLAQGNPRRAKLLVEPLRRPFPGGAAESTRVKTLAEIALSLPANQQSAIVAIFEPYPIWTRPFLVFRASAYQRTGDLRAAKAAADLREFDRNAR